MAQNLQKESTPTVHGFCLVGMEAYFFAFKFLEGQSYHWGGEIRNNPM